MKLQQAAAVLQTQLPVVVVAVMFPGHHGTSSGVEL
jgi:hypothetical protein